MVVRYYITKLINDDRFNHKKSPMMTEDMVKVFLFDYLHKIKEELDFYEKEQENETNN